MTLFLITATAEELFLLQSSVCHATHLKTYGKNSGVHSWSCWVVLSTGFCCASVLYGVQLLRVPSAELQCIKGFQEIIAQVAAKACSNHGP